MAIGGEWAGVAGAAVGGALGIVGALVSQMRDSSSRREDRRAQFEREDHLREIELRRELYSECLAAVSHADHAMAREIADAGSEPIAVDVPEVAAAVEQLVALEARLALSAPMSVREPMRGIIRVLRTIVRDANVSLATTMDLFALKKSATDHMRADLRIVDTVDAPRKHEGLPKRQTTNYQLGDG